MFWKSAIVLSKALGTLAVGAVVAGTAVMALVPRVTGTASLTVLSGSMSPTIPKGSVVLVRPVDPGQLQPGDVITWQVQPGVASYITHRVVRVQHDTEPVTFITKGDANEGEDTDPIPVTAVRGKVVFHVPHLGTVSNAARGGAGLGVAAIALGIAALASVVRWMRTPDQPAEEREPVPA